MTTDIDLREIVPSDESLLYRIYSSTREQELEQVSWEDSEKEAFLKMQYKAQRDYYRSKFPDADFMMILKSGSPAGRLYVDRSQDEILIIDIALLPEHRNAGIGTSLLRALLDEAAREGKPVRIHVERFNPALRLYSRLGFKLLEDKGVYFLMEFKPE